ncbi:MAG TPA: mismatch-specific DNA-glycosylase [Vicinamibacterales bacterium]
MARRPTNAWESLRLTDRIAPGVRVLFVGINPGVRSAETGHHFAGPSNRFWKLLFESGLVPEPITFEQDTRLPEFGYGITNIIARPSPGIDVLKPAEYVAGWHILEQKIDRFRPEILALVGVTVFRAVLPFLAEPARLKPRPTPATARLKPRPTAAKATLKRRPTSEATIGLQPYSVHGARVFVLPNPSGRNANFSYAEMLEAFRSLYVESRRRRRARA